MPELLTPAEHAAIAQAGDLYATVCALTADGPARGGDLSEVIFHIHGIQRAVLKNAAARAFPDLYRLLGGWPAGAGQQPPPTGLCKCGHAKEEHSNAREEDFGCLAEGCWDSGKCRGWDPAA